MRSYILLLVVLASSFAAKAKSYTETRVVESGGKEFTCDYKITYSGKTVDQSKSTIACTPKKNSGAVTEDFYIADLDMTVSVSHEIKKGKGKKITIEEVETPVAGQASLSCQCRLPLSSSPPMAMGRVLVKPSTSSLLNSLLPKLADRQIFGNWGNSGGSGSNIDLGSLLGGGSNDGSNIDLGSLLGGGSNSGSNIDLGALLGGGSTNGGSSDLVNQLVMQMVQQQMDDFINNGGAETMLTEMIQNGQLEQMLTQMMDSGMLENTMEQMMESGAIEQAIRQAMEQMMGQMMESNGMESFEGLEELMGQMNLEEMMGQMEQMDLQEFLSELMEGQVSMAEMMENLNMEAMEMNMDCDCVPAS